MEHKQLGPESETVTNEQGGKQSRLDFRFDLFDPKAMFNLAGILDYGAKKYGVNNWKQIPRNDHLNHALVHIYAYLEGNRQDDHLGHAFCRLMFAIGTEEEIPTDTISDEKIYDNNHRFGNSEICRNYKDVIIELRALLRCNADKISLEAAQECIRRISDKVAPPETDIGFLITKVLAHPTILSKNNHTRQVWQNLQEELDRVNLNQFHGNGNSI